MNTPFSELFLLLIITMSYGFVYSFMDPHDFGFKDEIDPFYFSFTTMSTVGYGDYSPQTNFSKLVVMSQLVISLASEVMIAKFLINVAKLKLQ
jgi:hypothetical protein